MCAPAYRPVRVAVITDDAVGITTLYHRRAGLRADELADMMSAGLKHLPDLLESVVTQKASASSHSITVAGTAVNLHHFPDYPVQTARAPERCSS